MDPMPFPSPQKSKGHYFLGLGLGLIPLILFLIVFAGPQGVPPSVLVAMLFASLALYGVVLIAAIVCLLIESVRWVGYGLLTAFLVSPVVAYIGCMVVINRPR